MTYSAIIAFNVLTRLFLIFDFVQAWVINPRLMIIQHRRQLFDQSAVFTLQSGNNNNNNNNVVDVDFERIDPSSSSSDSTKKKEKLYEDEEDGKNLFDLSLESDPEFSNTRIQFLDYSKKDTTSGGTNYIDVKLAFMTELDGAQYGIAIPYDPAVAITLENTDGTITYFSPDDDNNIEIMNIMATQLNEHVGTDLHLQRTPRILTVHGPLHNYTKNWKEKLIPKPYDVKEFLSDEQDYDTELKEFHEFMKKELGEEEYYKTMNGEDDEIDEEMEELYKLFDIPGLGTQKDDIKGIEEMMGTLLTPEKDFEKTKIELGIDDDEKYQKDGDVAALKLVSYILKKEGKVYSLVQLLQPLALVAKYITDSPKEAHFELLTPQEEELIIPKLEKICKADLEQAKLNF